MKCSDVMDKLEQLSPASFAEKWDNVGLLIGRKDKEIKKVMVALDATDDVISQAVDEQVDLLLTHHPLIFTGQKKIANDNFVGRRIHQLIRNDMNYFAMHTNFDVMGMADAAADEIQLRKREVLDITYEDDISKEGIGRIGILPCIMTLKECAMFCKEKFDLEQVRVYGDLSEEIETVAIVPGSGKDYVNLALEKNADVIITGDISHHIGMDAVLQGLNVIDAGHYGLEKIFCTYMIEVFKREMPSILVLQAKEESPFWVI